MGYNSVAIYIRLTVAATHIYEIPQKFSKNSNL